MGCPRWDQLDAECIGVARTIVRTSGIQLICMHNVCVDTTWLAIRIDVAMASYTLLIGRLRHAGGNNAGGACKAVQCEQCHTFRYTNGGADHIRLLIHMCMRYMVTLMYTRSISFGGGLCVCMVGWGGVGWGGVGWGGRVGWGGGGWVGGTIARITCMVAQVTPCVHTNSSL